MFHISTVTPIKVIDSFLWQLEIIHSFWALGRSSEEGLMLGSAHCGSPSSGLSGGRVGGLWVSTSFPVADPPSRGFVAWVSKNRY